MSNIIPTVEVMDWIGDRAADGVKRRTIAEFQANWAMGKRGVIAQYTKARRDYQEHQRAVKKFRSGAE